MSDSFRQWYGYVLEIVLSVNVYIIKINGMDMLIIRFYWKVTGNYDKFNNNTLCGNCFRLEIKRKYSIVEFIWD